MLDNTGVAVLRNFDTPTVCNALEMIDPSRRDFGYTCENLFCINPSAGPVVGFACTATMRSLRPAGLSGIELKKARLSYYKYISEAEGPKVCLMQDLDGSRAAVGPFWGEFNTRIHRALGCVGIITDGSVRDVGHLPSDILILSAGVRPSHAHVHLVEYAVQVNICGMVVSPGDLVHADIHGAVSFPRDLVPLVLQKATEFQETEAPIIEACKRDSITFEELSALYMAR
jgi:regulator of RNase E activity RraA